MLQKTMWPGPSTCDNIVEALAKSSRMDRPRKFTTKKQKSHKSESSSFSAVKAKSLPHSIAASFRTWCQKNLTKRYQNKHKLPYNFIHPWGATGPMTTSRTRTNSPRFPSRTDTRRPRFWRKYDIDLSKMYMKKTKNLTKDDYETTEDGRQNYPEYSEKILKTKNYALLKNFTQVKGRGQVTLPGLAWQIGLRNYWFK